MIENFHLWTASEAEEEDYHDDDAEQLYTLRKSGKLQSIEMWHVAVFAVTVKIAAMILLINLHRDLCVASTFGHSPFVYDARDREREKNERIPLNSNCKY